MKKPSDIKVQKTINMLKHLRQYKDCTGDDLMEIALDYLQKHFIKTKVKTVKSGEIQCPVCKSKFKLENIDIRPNLEFGKE